MNGYRLSDRQISAMYKLFGCGLNEGEVLFLLSIYDESFLLYNISETLLHSIKRSINRSNLNIYEIRDRRFGVLILDEYDIVEISKIMAENSIPKGRKSPSKKIFDYLLKNDIGIPIRCVERVKSYIKTNPDTKLIYEKIRAGRYECDATLRNRMMYQRLTWEQVARIRSLISSGYSTSRIIDEVFGYISKDAYRVAL